MKGTGKIFSALTLVLVGAVICAGCISFDPSSPSITGHWVLDSDERISITFYPDGTFGARAPVNGLGGSYTVSGDKLLIGEGIIQTLVAGLEADMLAEDAFLAGLQNAALWKIADDKLFLADADNQILFIFSASLIGEWVLTDDSSVSITFNDDGTVHGHARINHYGGQYFIDGSSLLFGEGFEMTEMAGSAADMKAEDEFIAALRATAGFVFESDWLVLVDENGRHLLHFGRV